MKTSLNLIAKVLMLIAICYTPVVMADQNSDKTTKQEPKKSKGCFEDSNNQIVC